MQSMKVSCDLTNSTFHTYRLHRAFKKTYSVVKRLTVMRKLKIVVFVGKYII